MNNDKMLIKKIAVSVAIFVTGMFSVSIANVFGGYFAPVISIEIVALTIYLNYIFQEKEIFKKNYINLCLVSLIVLFGLIFFVVNDLIGVQVYVRDSLGFFGICVISSQIISIASLIYVLVNFLISANKNHIEVVDETEEKKVETEEKVVTEKEIDKEEEIINEEEIKSISENNLKVDAPFMEEEN